MVKCDKSEIKLADHDRLEALQELVKDVGAMVKESCKWCQWEMDGVCTAEKGYCELQPIRARLFPQDRPTTKEQL